MRFFVPLHQIFEARSACKGMVLRDSSIRRLKQTWKICHIEIEKYASLIQNLDTKRIEPFAASQTKGDIGKRGKMRIH